MKKDSLDIKKNEEALITFLAETKDGKYAPIEDDSLKYLRSPYLREPDYCSEYYYYSTR